MRHLCDLGVAFVSTLMFKTLTSYVWIWPDAQSLVEATSFPVARAQDEIGLEAPRGY